MTITILTHDDRWKGLVPTVKRAAEAVFNNLSKASMLRSSPLGGELNRPSSDLVGGHKLGRARKSERMLGSNTPHQIPSGIWLPPKGGATESAVTVESYRKLTVTLVLTSDAEVKTLNRDFRGKNTPTNVLSFPDGSTFGGVKQLGDVVLAYETLTREADAQGKPLKAHLTHLTIHGVLHLLGHDHETRAEAEAMESLEIALLRSMGIANPYEAD